MSIDYTPWPEAFATRYINKGYWTFESITHVVSRHMQDTQIASHCALICQERHFSYADLEVLSDNFAIHLRQQGFKKGDTAVVQLPNIAEFYIVFLGLIKAGLVPVNALFNHQKLELRAYAEQVKPALMIVSSRHALFKEDTFSQALNIDISSIRHWLVEGDANFGLPLDKWLSKPPCSSVNDTLSFNQKDAANVAFFQLSGGSTGTPKLIPRTHNDYYYSIRASAEICQLNTDSVYLCALPAPHNFSLSSPGALGVFYAGGTVVLTTDPSPMTCFPLIEQHQVTMTALVPPVVNLWLQEAANQGSQLNSLAVLQVGGARLSESVAKKISPILGCQLQQVFGMAEGLVNYTRFDDDNWHILNTQGSPISDDDEIKIVDENDQPVAEGEEGALLTRGPYTFRGYFNSPEHNASAFDEQGFYRSGDIVKRTSSGYLIVVGREKDQINRGGEKIAAEEIESILLRHEAISTVALVAMPDLMMGEKSCAFVMATDPKLKPITLRKYLRKEGVAEYKLPDRFEFNTQLPTTAVGKVDKKLLRQIIASKLTPSFHKDI